MAENFVLRGNVCYNQDAQTLKIVEQGYAVCMDGRSAGVYRELPKMYAALPLTDYGGRLIVPKLVDLHLYAPQYSFRGLGMGLELSEWPNTWTFPEEAKYKDNEYAKKTYSISADNMKRSVTMRVCIPTTLYRDTTEILMDLMGETELRTMVGKVDMNYDSSDFLVEEGSEALTEETIRQLEGIEGKYKNTMSILILHFIPTCSDELMERLKEIQTRHDLPMQSRLSENREEISQVQELCLWSEFYGDAYDHFGLFGGRVRTIMTHCVWSSHEEVSRVRNNDVFVVHCPQSNTNLSSGIVLVETYLDQGIRVGLSTDVAEGIGESIFQAMADAVQVSKLHWRLADRSLKLLTVEEAFHSGTVGDRAFFGKVGSFEEGHEFDTVVFNDQSFKHPQSLGVKERLKRFICLSDECHVNTKYVLRGNIFQVQFNIIPFH